MKRTLTSQAFISSTSRGKDYKFSSNKLDITVIEVPTKQPKVTIYKQRFVKPTIYPCRESEICKLLWLMLLFR